MVQANIRMDRIAREYTSRFIIFSFYFVLHKSPNHPFVIVQKKHTCWLVDFCKQQYYMSVMLMVAVIRKSFWYGNNSVRLAVLQVEFYHPEYHTQRKGIIMENKPLKKNPMATVLGIRDFRLLWIGGSISILGSQFSAIAMPWLVLQLTGDPLALGLVLALGGIPRAVFMLIGGVVTDRFSPRLILLACDWINFVLAGLIAVLVFTGSMQVWMLYILSLVTGLLAGFVIPAAQTMVPRLVSQDDLQAGNSITMGSSQLAGLIGPSLAGIVIGAYAHSTLGIAIAFAVDSVSFAVSAIALWMMRGGGKQAPASVHEQKEGIFASIRTGIRYLIGHGGLRFMFTIMMAVNFLFVGPLLVGIPVLADQRLPEGARAFGFLMSAYSGGNLLGFLLAGFMPKPTGRWLSGFIIVLLVAFGAVLAGMGWITITWVDAILMLILGIGNGYIGLIIFTWVQQRTPKDMLGRMMSMMTLASMGLVPLSQALAGAISKWNLTALFVVAGSLILLAALWAALQPELKSLSSEMVSEQPT
jgi:MFS family permease